jgi:hypothetical protein
MTKLAPIILQTTPSMWHPSELEVEGYAFTKYDLRQPRRGVEGWWVGSIGLQGERYGMAPTRNNCDPAGTRVRHRRREAAG